MVKAKQPSAKTDEMIEGDVLEKPAQAKESRPSGASAKATRSVQTSGHVLLIALASLVSSIIALGFASFAVWQSDQIAEVEVSKSETVEKRFASLEAAIEANGISQQKEIVDLSKRYDQLSIATLSNKLVDTDKTGSTDSVNESDTKHVAARIDQRFVALEMAVKDLADAMTIKQADMTVSKVTEVGDNKNARSDFSVTPNQASILIISGLLADNMSGAPLDRWISLLQVLTDQGATIPDLDQLRIAATPTPERSLSLIHAAYDLVPQMIKALNQADNDTGFLEKTSAKLGQLIRLREIGSGADGNELALRAFESAIAIQDLNGAVRAAGQWAGSDLPSLKNWIGLAQRRQSLDRVVSTLVADRLAGALSVQ
ncbi:hypothetical protein OAJ84_00605 [Candidatus Puniceispirillum sp.]|nr:hypothetical protein [Candidatus Puniceispirillum sp.]